VKALQSRCEEDEPNYSTTVTKKSFVSVAIRSNNDCIVPRKELNVTSRAVEPELKFQAPALAPGI